jgi:hypothetical protein
VKVQNYAVYQCRERNVQHFEHPVNFHGYLCSLVRLDEAVGILRACGRLELLCGNIVVGLYKAKSIEQCVCCSLGHPYRRQFFINAVLPISPTPKQCSLCAESTITGRE